MSFNFTFWSCDYKYTLRRFHSPDSITIEEEERLVYGIGKQFSITLPSNPSTGYKWVVTDAVDLKYEGITADSTSRSSGLLDAPMSLPGVRLHNAFQDSSRSRSPMSNAVMRKTSMSTTTAYLSRRRGERQLCLRRNPCSERRRECPGHDNRQSRFNRLSQDHHRFRKLHDGQGGVHHSGQRTYRSVGLLDCRIRHPAIRPTTRSSLLNPSEIWRSRVTTHLSRTSTSTRHWHSFAEPEPLGIIHLYRRCLHGSDREHPRCRFKNPFHHYFKTEIWILWFQDYRQSRRDLQYRSDSARNHDLRYVNFGSSPSGAAVYVDNTFVSVSFSPTVSSPKRRTISCDRTLVLPTYASTAYRSQGRQRVENARSPVHMVELYQPDHDITESESYRKNNWVNLMPLFLFPALMENLHHLAG